MKIAIIGSGIAGNVVAHRLHREHDITVYEAARHVGGHTHTHNVEKQGRCYQVDTGFIGRHQELLFHRSDRDRVQDLPLASLYLLLRMEQASRRRAGTTDPGSPWNASNAWRLNQETVHTGAIVLNGVEHDVPVTEVGSGGRRRFRITVGEKSVMAAGELEGNELYADIDGHRQRVVVVPGDNGQFTLFGPRGAMQFALAQPDIGADDALAGAADFTTPMPGIVVRLLVEPGQPVERGQPLLILEAMKMEHRICAPADGKVTAFYFEVGEQVAGGDELLDFAAADPE